MSLKGPRQRPVSAQRADVVQAGAGLDWIRHPVWSWGALPAVIATEEARPAVRSASTVRGSCCASGPDHHGFGH